MADLMFPDYMASKESYDACRQFWNEVFCEIADKRRVADQWVDYGTVNLRMGDGRELHPVDAARILGGGTGRILKKISPCLKALFIFQTDFTDRDFEEHPYDEFGITCQLDRSDWENEYTDGDLDVLYLRIDLMNDTLEEAKRVISYWVDPSISLEDMSHIIKDNNWV